MSTLAERVVAALSLPASSRVDQRVPKKLLLDNGAPTAADRRLVAESIDEIQWVAALKPNTIGVPGYRDAVREYLEIAVLTVVLRGTITAANVARIRELVHRAVPYPVLLLEVGPQALSLSLGHKRWSQNEAGKVVLDGGVIASVLSEESCSSEVWNLFFKSLSISGQPQATLLNVYQGWIDSVEALQAAVLTGIFRSATTPDQSDARRNALADCARLEAEVSRLRLQALKERQIARQVDLNLRLKRVQEELISAREKL